MSSHSPLFDKIRISRPQDEEKPAERGCDHPGCRHPGGFRAPMGRHREGRYYHFCLEHVQAYNKSYNYFKDMPDDAIAAFQKDAITGHRPTWTIGLQGGRGPGAPDDSVSDVLGMFRNGRRAAPQAQESRRVSPGARKALDALGLDEGASREEVRTQFKALAKRFHPDLNGGDRSREDKLRNIIDAYNYLKSAGHA